MYGDSYLDTKYPPIVEAFKASVKVGLMTVFHNENRWEKSNVEFADGVIRHYGKTSNTALHSTNRPGFQQFEKKLHFALSPFPITLEASDQ